LNVRQSHYWSKSPARAIVLTRSSKYNKKVKEFVIENPACAHPHQTGNNNKKEEERMYTKYTAVNKATTQI
jgi:hypothetical protein